MLNFVTLIASAKLNFGENGAQRKLFIDIESSISFYDDLLLKQIKKLSIESRLSTDEIISIIRLYRSKVERTSYRIASVGKLSCSTVTETINNLQSITTTIISDNTVNAMYITRFNAMIGTQYSDYTVTLNAGQFLSNHESSSKVAQSLVGINEISKYANNISGTEYALSTTSTLSGHSYSINYSRALSSAKITSKISGLYLKYSTNLRNINTMWDGWLYVPPPVYVDPRRYCGLNFCITIQAQKLNFTDACCGDTIPPDENSQTIPTKGVYMLSPTSSFKDDLNSPLNCTSMVIRSSLDSFCYSVSATFPLASKSLLTGANYFIANDCGTNYKLYLTQMSISRAFGRNEISAEFSTMHRELTDIITVYPDNGQTNVAGLAQLLMTGLTIDMVQPDFYIDPINLSGVDTAAKLLAKMLSDCGLRMITGRSDGVLYIRPYYPSKGWETQTANINLPLAFTVTEGDKTEFRPTFNSVTITGTGTVPISANVVAGGINSIAEMPGYSSNILQHQYPIASLGAKLLTNNGSRRVVSVSVDTDSTIPLFTVGDKIGYDNTVFYLTNIVKSIQFGHSQADLTLEKFIYD